MHGRSVEFAGIAKTTKDVHVVHDAGLLRRIQAASGTRIAGSYLLKLALHRIRLARATYIGYSHLVLRQSSGLV